MHHSPSQPRNHLFLSPHLDDAAFSCGGLIHRRARAGERVVVLTVCAGAPPGGPLSPYAALLHRRWGMTSEAESGVDAAAAVVAQRRAEDAAALARLGAEGVYLDVPDVIYRRDPSGAPLVDGDAVLFGGFRPAERPLAASIAGQLAVLARQLTAWEGRPSAPANTLPLSAAGAWPRVYAPLGVGGHVDHWLVRAAAEAWVDEEPAIRPQLAYYEDYPYSAQPGEIERVIGSSPDESATWTPCPIDLGEADLAAKIDAIGAYASQISSFWSDTAAMAEAVRAFARGPGVRGGRGERLWVRGVCPGGIDG